jgi:hypothetical protein
VQAHLLPARWPAGDPGVAEPEPSIVTNYAP